MENIRKNIWRFCLILFGSIIFASVAFAANKANLPQNMIKIIETIIQFDLESGDKSKAIWQGFSPIKRPLLIYFDGVGSVLFNHPKPPADFNLFRRFLPKMIAIDKPIFFRAGALSENFSSVYSYLNYNNRKTFFFNALTDDKFGLLAHESFHFYQEKYFKAIEIPYSKRDDFSIVSDKSLATMYLEQIMLAQALLSESDWKESVKNFIALRSERYLWENPFVIKREEQMEQLEGSAQYVEMKSEKWLEHWPENYAQIKTASLLTVFLSPAYMERSRYYHTGPAQMLILDKMNIDWKKEVASGKSIFEILKKAMKLKKTEIPSIIKKIHFNYDFSSLMNTARKKRVEELDKRKIKLKEFNSANREKIILGIHKFPKGWSGSIGQAPIWISMSGQAKFFPELRIREFNNQNYGYIKIRNTMLKYTKKREEYCYDLEILLSLNEKPEFIVDGKKFIPSVHNAEFKHIEIHSKTLKLNLKLAGAIRRERNKTIVNFQEAEK